MTGVAGDIVYYNFSIDNSTGTVPLPAQQTDRRTSPILERPREWYATIARAVAPLDEIGLFTFVDNGLTPYVVPGLYTFANYNLLYTSAYIITMEYSVVGNAAYKKCRIYVPFDPTPAVDPTFKRIFHVQTFLRMINNALFTAYDGMFAAAGPLNPGPAIPAAPVGEYAPYMTYDPATELFSLVAAKNRFSTDEPAVTRLNIWMGTTLYLFFDYFDDVLSSFDDPNNMNFRINIFNSYDNSIYGTRGVPVFPTPATNSYIMTQEISNLFGFRDWASLVFTTSMPIVYEQQQGRIGGSAASFPIMLDTAINAELIKRTTVEFLPNPLRWIDMIGDNHMNQVDFAVYVQSKDGTLTLLNIPAGRILTIKLEFRRKPQLVV